MLKFNVDGAVQAVSRCLGSDIVARDWQGNFIAAKTKMRNGFSCPLIA